MKIILSAMTLLLVLTVNDTVKAQTFQASNGSVYRILYHAHLTGGRAGATVVARDNPEDIGVPMSLLFDCKGHAVQDVGYSSNYLSIPRRSVLAAIQNRVCKS